MPDFIDISNTESSDLRQILESAKILKTRHKQGEDYRPLPGKQLAMVFEKPSTRTRTSFEVGISQLGGNAVVITADQSQIGRGETIADTARVLSRYVDIIMIRCFHHTTLTETAKYSDVPVINGLSNYSHPCQIMADIQTFEEHRGNIEGKTIAWVGDSNNVTVSWIHAATKLGFTLNISSPAELLPSSETLEWAKKNGGIVNIFKKPEEAVKGAHLVTTDTWISMGCKDPDNRRELLTSYQVTASLMAKAESNALFMHCLPAHRGEEVTDDVIDGPQSVVFDEAENRLHVQKAIMIWCLNSKK